MPFQIRNKKLFISRVRLMLKIFHLGNAHERPQSKCLAWATFNCYIFEFCNFWFEFLVCLDQFEVMISNIVFARVWTYFIFNWFGYRKIRKFGGNRMRRTKWFLFFVPGRRGIRVKRIGRYHFTGFWWPRSRIDICYSHHGFITFLWFIRKMGLTYIIWYILGSAYW